MAAKKKAAKKKTIRRTTLRSSKGTKLYAVRAADGTFKDIQTYKRAHSAEGSGQEEGRCEEEVMPGGARQQAPLLPSPGFLRSLTATRRLVICAACCCSATPTSFHPAPWGCSPC